MIETFWTPLSSLLLRGPHEYINCGMDCWNGNYFSFTTYSFLSAIQACIRQRLLWLNIMWSSQLLVVSFNTPREVAMVHYVGCENEASPSNQTTAIVRPAKQLITSCYNDILFPPINYYSHWDIMVMKLYNGINNFIFNLMILLQVHIYQ